MTFNNEQDLKNTIALIYAVVAAGFLLIGYAVSIIIGNVLALIGIPILLSSALAINDYFIIPANPPHRGVVTLKGKRLENFSLDEQWGFLPFRGLLFDVIKVNVKRKTISEEEGESPKIVTRTPDKAQNEVYYDIAFIPHTDYLINYLNSGGYEGVVSQFKSEAGEQIREWAEGDEQGPKTWHELYKAKTAAVSVLVKRIATKDVMDDLAKIPDYAQSVPTQIWLKFFSKPGRLESNEPWPNETFFKNEEMWAKNNWEKVRSVLNGLSDGRVRYLKSAVKKRREVLEKLRSGDAKILLEDLGIELQRLNINNVEVIGAVKEAADQEAKEEQERTAEMLENKHVQDLVNSWDGKEERDENGKVIRRRPELSAEEAVMVVQTERGKLERKIDEKHISLGDSAAETLPKVNLINLFGGSNG